MDANGIPITVVTDEMFEAWMAAHPPVAGGGADPPPEIDPSQLQFDIVCTHLAGIEDDGPIRRFSGWLVEHVPVRPVGPAPERPVGPALEAIHDVPDQPLPNVGGPSKMLRLSDGLVCIFYDGVYPETLPE